MEEAGWHAHLPEVGTTLQIVAVEVRGEGARFHLCERRRGIVWVAMILFSRGAERVGYAVPSFPSSSSPYPS
eukprot:10406319-Lingulodinium_polyedra.AAC.1